MSFLCRLTLAGCLCSLVGCQSTGMGQWAFWKPAVPSHADRTDGLKDPTRTHLAYAHLQEHTGNLQEARESYQIALEHDGKSVEAVLGLARLDHLGGRDKQAEQRFKQALLMAPENELVVTAVAQFYVSQERYDDAAALLQKAVAADPDNRKLQFNLGEALARAGKISEAERHFVQAVGEPEADYNIGLIHYERGEVVPAEQRLQRALQRKPSLVQAKNWLDEIHRETGKRTAIAGTSNGRQVETLPPPAQTLGRGESLTAPSPRAAGPQVDAPGLPSPAVPQAVNAGTPSAPTGSSGLVGVGMTVPQQPTAASANPWDPSRMSAAQLEQYENSLSPAEREQFRAQLRLGQAFNR